MKRGSQLVKVLMHCCSSEDVNIIGSMPKLQHFSKFSVQLTLKFVTNYFKDYRVNLNVLFCFQIKICLRTHHSKSHTFLDLLKLY